jgi:hypothetical protein
LFFANYQLQAWHSWRFEKVVDPDHISAMNSGFFLQQLRSTRSLSTI